MLYALIRRMGEYSHKEYTMNRLSGIGKIDRVRIAAIIRGTKGTISVNDASDILSISATDAAKMLSRWAKKGWMSRIKRGLYVPVPLESRTAELSLEDPWLIAARIYGPCYIGGWSAAEYLDLTEQVFNTIVVMTIQKPRDRNPIIKGTRFLLRTIPEKAMFGLKPVWRGQVRISVSDSTRTIIDVLNDPALGGGMRSVKDMFIKYLRSDNKRLDLLIDYADLFGNGAVFKRLGFLLETMMPDETEAREQCSKRLTAGNAKLDPKLNNSKLITRWRLWVPETWKRIEPVD